MRQVQRSKRARRGLSIVVIGATLLVTACSSDDDTSTTEPSNSAVTSDAPDTTEAVDTTEAPADTEATADTEPTDTEAPADTEAPEGDTLGEPNPASGEPLKIGYVYDGVSETVDRSEELVAAQAAAEYVNEYLGGIGGRPIEFEVCETGSTPAGAADCVTQMVTDGVPAVVNGITNVPGALYPALAEAGIAVFAGGGIERASLGTPGISLMGNALLTVLAGPAQVAADAGITQAAIAVVDNPAASGALEEQAPLFYGNVDVGVEVVAIPVDTPDVSPQIAAALTQDPGLFQIVGDPPFCGKVMRALDSAGYDGLIVVIPNCLEGGQNTDLPNLEGSILLTTSSTDPTGPEVQLYNAVLDEFAASDVDRFAGGPINGYQSVVAFARVLAGLTGDATADSVKAAIAAAPPTDYPIADGMTFQCNGTAVVIAPNICTNATLQTVLDAEGKGTTYTVLDGTDVLTLG